MSGSASPSLVPRIARPVAAAMLATVALACQGPAPAHPTGNGISGAAGGAAGGSVPIDGGTRYQTIAGFGVSEGFGQAETIMKGSPSVRQRALRLLFATSGGAGLTILRTEISADAGDTIEPRAPSAATAAPAYVPLSSVGDDQGQLWLAQQLKVRYGVTDVLADAWSAPAFMKTNHSVDHGGTLCGVPGAACPSGDWRQAYANYLKQYAADYAAAGVPLSYIGPVNEPSYAPPSYDGMTLTPSQTANFLGYLGRTLASSGLPTKVECCATIGWNDAQRYAAAIEANPAARGYTALFGSHGYKQPPAAPLSGWSKPAWQTEWSTFEAWDPAWDDDSAASGLSWAQHIFAGLDNSNLSAFLYWWGSSTPNENGDNESLIQISRSSVTPSGRLWAFASFSDFVRPGAVRIGATASGGDLTLAAFRNTSGTIAIVALNTGTSADPVTFSLTGTGTRDGAIVTPYLTNSSSSVAAGARITVSGGRFAATLPPRSLVTYVVAPPGALYSRHHHITSE
jgi:glucuronoarabinoxylan endo-1,4-beta-xylanase